VDLAQFILLELLRTDAINHDEIQYLKAVFDSLEKDKSSTYVEYDEIEECEEEEEVLETIVEESEASKIEEGGVTTSCSEGDRLISRNDGHDDGQQEFYYY
jgi:hypothetical protein